MGSVAFIQQFLDNARELRIRWPGKEYSDQWIFSASVVGEIVQARGEGKLNFAELPEGEQDVVPFRPLIRPEVMHNAPVDETVIAAHKDAQRHKYGRKFLAAIALALKQNDVIASLDREQVRRGLRPSSHADIFG